ncbi:MAG: efflux RND transporter periplasmic adaptor subunit [Betaproteobacteria bacterium]|nr:efflux RND transporter periplasmic adaptor subunit [Betaproteobacteria bacterium]
MLLGAGAASWLRPSTKVSSQATRTSVRPPSAPIARRVLYWASPMDPSIHSDHPMKDSMGMDYLPVYAPQTSATAATGLRVDPRTAQNLGVRVVKVALRSIGQAIHTVGTVALDENRVYTVTPRYGGWVVNLHVRAVGDPVHRGEVLAELYSPDLYNAEEDYLLARRQGNSPDLVAAARERLRLLGMSDHDIVSLAREGKAPRDVALRAPASGVITRLRVRQGGYVSPQTQFFEIANLERVWVDTALYGYQLPWVGLGDPVRLHLSAYPQRTWSGTLGFLYPTLNPKSRTVSARLSIANPDGVLRPGMYATATLLGRARPALAVPQSAVLHADEADFVMVAQGEGHFLPVQVALGAQADGWIQVRHGLRAGEAVVQNAQFLLYSESQFQSVKARMLGSNLEGSQP